MRERRRKKEAGLEWGLWVGVGEGGRRGISRGETTEKELTEMMDKFHP